MDIPDQTDVFVVGGVNHRADKLTGQREGGL